MSTDWAMHLESMFISHLYSAKWVHISKYLHIRFWSIWDRRQRCWCWIAGEKISAISAGTYYSHRAERRKDQVCSPFEYEKVFQRIGTLPSTMEHLIVLLGIPIAYPRMVFLESALESKLNPLVALGRNGSFGLSGFVNKFNADAELLDDLNDHWTARAHKVFGLVDCAHLRADIWQIYEHERNWLIKQMQRLALAQRVRISFLSGDVHCAAVGVLKTHRTKKEAEIPIGLDHRYMLNIVTSLCFFVRCSRLLLMLFTFASGAIVNTPP